MANTKYQPVSITLDGMMLFYFNYADNQQHYGRCEVRCLKKHDHQIKIEVRKTSDGGLTDSVVELENVTHDELTKFKSLWLHIGDYTVDDSGRAEVGKSYKLIPALDGEHFYNKPGQLKLKHSEYHPTLHICDGTIGTDDASKSMGEDFCHRVIDAEGKITIGNKTINYSFSDLEYAEEGKWDEIKKYFCGLVKPLKPFPRWLDGTLSLEAGKSLWLTGVDENAVTSHPLIQDYNENDNYWICISHLDDEANPPKSLGDCKGFGHLCESFELDDDEPLYGVFAPNPANPLLTPNPPWRVTTRTSDITCCKSACVSGYQ